MTTIERLRRKKGDAFRIRYYFDGRRFKISLPAGISRARVNEFANVVDALVAARKYAENPPRAVAVFLQEAPPIFLNKLARVGLIAIEKPLTLQQAAETFLARVKATLKTRSYQIRLAALRLLLDHFGRDAPVLSIDSTAAAALVAISRENTGATKNRRARSTCVPYFFASFFPAFYRVDVLPGA